MVKQKSTKPELFTLKEVSIMFRRSEQTVRQRIKAGELNCIREGRKILFTSEQLNNYVDKNTIQQG